MAAVEALLVERVEDRADLGGVDVLEEGCVENRLHHFGGMPADFVLLVGLVQVGFHRLHFGASLVD